MNKIFIFIFFIFVFSANAGEKKTTFNEELFNKARNVKEIVKLNPNSSGITEPKTIPKIVEICQTVQHVKPAPNK